MPEIDQNAPLASSLVLTLSLFVFLSSREVAAEAVRESLVGTLVRTGTVSCEPALRHFCRNIHIGCSGRTAIKAFPFVLTVEGERAQLSNQDRGPRVDRQTRSGRIEFADDLAYAIVRLRPSADYVRVNADGTYSFRLYSRGVGTMSYGTCD